MLPEALLTWQTQKRQCWFISSWAETQCTRFLWKWSVAVSGPFLGSWELTGTHDQVCFCLNPGFENHLLFPVSWLTNVEFGQLNKQVLSQNFLLRENNRKFLGRALGRIVTSWNCQWSLFPVFRQFYLMANTCHSLWRPLFPPDGSWIRTRRRQATGSHGWS